MVSNFQVDFHLIIFWDGSIAVLVAWRRSEEKNEIFKVDIPFCYDVKRTQIVIHCIP